MSKILTRNTHYMPKTGSYSVRLNRRGDIGEAAPHNAIDTSYRALFERAELVRSQVHALEKEISANRRLYGPAARAKHLDLTRRKSVLEAEIKALRGEQHHAYLPAYAHHFITGARLLLPAATLQEIENYVVMRVGTPPRGWNRFLGDAGLGKEDGTQRWTDTLPDQNPEANSP